MGDPLATYLHDHLAGGVAAIGLLESMNEEYLGKPLGDFAAALLVEIKADHQALRESADRIGDSGSKMKELTSWLGEKASRLKMNHVFKNGLGTFEALEFLEVGIHGKWALWRALNVAAASDPRLRGIDFDHLIARAESQRAIVEDRRLAVARTALQFAEK